MITLVLLNFTRRLSRKLRPPSRSIKFKTKINPDLNNLLFSCLSCSIPVISWYSNWLIKTFVQTDWGYIGFGFWKLSENCSILVPFYFILANWASLHRTIALTLFMLVYISETTEVTVMLLGYSPIIIIIWIFFRFNLADEARSV